MVSYYKLFYYVYGRYYKLRNYMLSHNSYFAILPDASPEKN